MYKMIHYCATVRKKPCLVSGTLITILMMACFADACARGIVGGNVNDAMHPSSASLVKVKGFLGQAMQQSIDGRLMSLPRWNGGQLITMFNYGSRQASTTHDWYGEHAGKWMYTTARAAFRIQDGTLRNLLLNTADYLVATQEPDGYLGTYSPARRITNHNALSHATSWDVWNLSYMVIGLLEVHRYFPDEKYLQAAKRIGELFLQTFVTEQQNITFFGTRRGLSATVILDPVVDLYRVTGDNRYLDFAGQVIRQMEQKDGLHLISDGLANRELEWIGDGKIYQLLWNLSAVVKLYRLTGNEDYLKAAETIWTKVHDFHLTITGGPWGGIGKHKECFNSRGYWSPYGYVETCSIMAWIQFNREMLLLKGEAKYAQEIEKAAYNALPGAQYPNGMDWCYHTFTNGATHTAHFNDCCPSSGALALEEIPPIIYTVINGGVVCNLYVESEASLSVPGTGTVRITQETGYPFDGLVKMVLQPEKKSLFSLLLRIPGWVTVASIRINGEETDISGLVAGEYFTVERVWRKGDVMEIMYPMEPTVVRQQEGSIAPQRGGPIYQVQWFALTRGPLVYAVSGLFEGGEREEIYALTGSNPERSFFPVSSPEGVTGQAYELRIPGKPTLLYLPFYEAGRRTSGAWRLTWVQEKIQ